jgi:hypothetical protein
MGHSSSTRPEREKASALQLIERALHETSVLHAETIKENWIRAELLIALKHLAGEP